LHIPCVTSRWFICLYVGCLPSDTVNMVWDGFVTTGTIFLMQIGLALLALREEELLAEEEPGLIIPLINHIAEDANNSAAVLHEASEGQGNIPPERVAILRTEKRKEVQAEVEETKLWFAQRNDSGGPSIDPQTGQTLKVLQKEVETKIHQIELLQEQLAEAKGQMEDLREWRQVTEEEAEVREAQVELLKNEIAILMSEDKKTEDNTERLVQLEAQMLAMKDQASQSPHAVRIRSQSAFSPGSKSPQSDVQNYDRNCPVSQINEGGVVKELKDSKTESVEELLVNNEYLSNKIRVLENELQRRNEAFDLQCGLLEATRDEKNTWQDATQVSNEFNVKLNMRIRDLEEELRKRDKDSAKMKMLTDDLKAKDDQICVLTQMLATFEQ